jgi:hypothetical protein
MEFLQWVRLTAQAEPAKQCRVAICIFPLQVIEERSTLVHHTNESATRMMVLLVRLEMFLQRVDVARQQCDLNLG